MFTVVGYYAWYKFEQLSGALLIKHTRENYLSHFYYGENAILNFQVFFFFVNRAVNRVQFLRGLVGTDATDLRSSYLETKISHLATDMWRARQS